MKTEDLFPRLQTPNDINVLDSWFDLPEDYKQFLAHYDVTKRKGEIKIHLPDKDDYLYLDQFFSAQQLIKENDQYRHMDVDLIHFHLIPIANTSASPYLCLKISPENFGAIYLQNWDLGLAKVADSLTDYLASLVTD